ncbi:putative wall-associated receptor kinase-like 16 [Prunus yedoensis var. nudiflora]|uniref:Putative wall-associated receptor kinase-like 16 n=1 Tax=Prunus yedoensis var. nudiflora TaxID=2094558 RepID=A0A314UKM2_PRUYE|nr:putative wall-associated receptor kinase-like 16 [Prunus yedoensis var. nudiflora]
MVLHYCFLGVLMPLSLLIAQAAAITEGPQLALPNCPDHCGNLIIPYPFGVKENCYLNSSFFINCTRDESREPQMIPYWGNTRIIVSNISLEEAELQRFQSIAKDCYNKQGNLTYRYDPSLSLRPPFTISHAKNKFFAVGCDAIALFEGYPTFSDDQESYIAGCMSVCNSLGNIDYQDSCSGVGCCQTSIPSGLKNLTVALDSVYNHTKITGNFSNCSYAFVVEETQFTFSSSSFQQLESVTKLPMVLNWAIGEENDSCNAAQKRQDFACKANSKCVKPVDRSAGYICQCLPGYQGNPYHPDGCQDIDECMTTSPCSETCENKPGYYTCRCPHGYKGDGKKNGTGCSKDFSLLLILSLGIGVGLLVLLVGSSWPIYWGMKKQKYIKLKEKYFKENGGLLLQQQLASYHGVESVETTKIFTAEELEKATDNYHESRVLGEGGYGIVYKGILADNKVVAIKKSKVGVPAQKEQFVNEVIVLSQINHRNVVRLLGCCLETPVPLLVYEYITNGTLFHHIHGQKSKGSSLSWELRLKIAAETAGALAYLHSSTSTPIIHRDVKATNILLDDNYMAKVSDFGASRLVPTDQTQVTTLVQGTLGYLDPEYFHSNQLTQKSDVYSFGVVLVELLTSKVAVSFARPESERNLASFFVCSMEEDGLNRIWDDTLFSEGNIETLKNVANLAKRCVSLKGKERPTMKEVASELEGMRMMAKHTWEVLISVLKRLCTCSGHLQTRMLWMLEAIAVLVLLVQLMGMTACKSKC